LKTLVIYDRNRMDSVFAAAALMSRSPVTASFVFAEKGDRHTDADFDRYLWLGVYPTKHHFNNWQEVTRKNHLVFASKANVKAAKDADLWTANWVFGVDSLPLFNARTYGAPTMLERVFGMLELEIGNSVASILIEKEFYDKMASQEALLRGIRNMRNALASLDPTSTVYGSPWAPTMAHGEEDEEVLSKLRAHTLVVLKRRSIVSSMSDKKETTEVKLITTYETENFWFTVRRFEELNLQYRNVTFGATGMIVLTNNNFMEDMKNNDVVFILNK
jgi:hypothetical protein